MSDNKWTIASSSRANAILVSRANAILVRRVVEEIWNQGNLELADLLFTADYVNSGGLIPNVVHGPEAIKFGATLHHTAYPRLHITIERMTSEGPLVAFQWIARDHADESTSDLDSALGGGTLRGMTFCLLTAGKIVESWTSWDSSVVLRKLVRAAGIITGRESVFLPA